MSLHTSATKRWWISSVMNGVNGAINRVSTSRHSCKVDSADDVAIPEAAT